MTLTIEGERSPEAGTDGVKTSVYCPEHIITNSQLVDYFQATGTTTSSGKEVTEEEIVRRTGIHRRHWHQPLDGTVSPRSQVVPSMGNCVAEKLVDELRLSEINCLFALTSFPYRQSLSRAVARHLEMTFLKPVTSVYPDGYGECASPIWLLHILRKRSQQFWGEKILVVASEYLSPIADGLNLTLLSDGAAAMSFTYGKDLEVLASAGRYFPKLGDLIRVSIKPEYVPPQGSLFLFKVGQPHETGRNREPDLEVNYGKIEGPKVFKFALDRNIWQSLIQNSLETVQLSPDQIDLVIPHQANGRITEGLRELLPKLGIDAEVYSNIENHGNTGAVSIPLAWHEANLEGKIKKGDHILLLGFGAGMTAAAAVVKVLK